MNPTRTVNDQVARSSHAHFWLVSLILSLGLLSVSLSTASIVLEQQHRAAYRGLEDASYNEILRLRESAWIGIRPRLAFQLMTVGMVMSILCLGVACFTRQIWLIAIAVVSLLAAAVAIGFNVMDAIPY